MSNVLRQCGQHSRHFNVTSVCCGPTLLAAHDIHAPIIKRLSNKQTQAFYSYGNVTSAEARLVKSQLQLHLLVLPSSFPPNEGLLTSKARATTLAELAMAQARSKNVHRWDVGRSEVNNYSNNFENYKTFEDKNHGRSSQSSFFSRSTLVPFNNIAIDKKNMLCVVKWGHWKEIATLNKLFTKILTIIIVHSSGKTVGQPTHGMTR